MSASAGTAGRPGPADPRAGGPRPTRREVWRLLGAPTDQVGSVNDPRTHLEHGVSWNEKWIYRDGHTVVRIVLWNRYDFLGAFRVHADGSVEPEPRGPDAGSR